MLSLPNVTLVAVSSVDLDGALFALSVSSHFIEFADVKFLTSEAIIPDNPKIKIELIPKLDLWGYSKYILQDLHKHVHTSHCLVVQADGFVLNPDRWQEQFLEYDYIGAPWAKKLTLQPTGEVLDMNKNQIGNGGFSLRSKKLLEATAKIDFDSLTFPSFSEDLIIGHFMLEQMLSAGIKFPAPELAAQFSIEDPNASFGQNPSTAFGFHGSGLRDALFAQR
jgi:hypothetical protein